MSAAEDLRAKLARLRREAPAAPPDAAPESAPGAEAPAALGAPASLDATIARLPLRLRANLARARSRAVPPQPVRPGDPPTRDVGAPAGLALADGPAGPYVARTTSAAVEDSHGGWRFTEALEVDVDPDVFALLTGDATLGSVDLGRAVYLDTETTGLDGGAGTYVFLVGLGWFEAERFVVQQSFLRGPEDEHALLAAVAARIAAAPAVVSFFGRVFDRHRLEDKMRVHGVAPPFAGRPHLDLCFPLRRLTKGAFRDARLQTLERELLGFARVDDMPGALAPAAWFDYVAERAHRLEGVFRHNLEDVRSLAALAAYLGRVPSEARTAGRPLPGPCARRALALARAFADRRDDARALVWYQRLFERVDGGPGDEPPLEAAAVDKARAEVQRLARRVARARALND